MEDRSRFFIYDRREVLALILLFTVVAAFAFTLGVHLGKVAGSPMTQVRLQANGMTSVVETVPDKFGNRQEFQDQIKGVHQAAEEALTLALQEEVSRTGLKLESLRQVELPKSLKSKDNQVEALNKHTPFQPEKPLVNPPSDESEKSRSKSDGNRDLALFSLPALQRHAPEGAFTLQVGSFNTVDMAKDHVIDLEAKHFKPFVRILETRTGGKRYQVYIGGFPNRGQAEKAGQRYRSEKVIDSFVIAKIQE